MSIRVRVVLLAFLLLASMFAPLAFIEPSSTSPGEVATRMNMESTSLETQGLARTDLPMNAEATAPSTTEIILTARFNYSSENGLSVTALQGRPGAAVEGRGPQLLRGKERHHGWRGQGHLHQPHRRPVRAHHQHLGPTIRRGEGHDDIVQLGLRVVHRVFTLSSSSTINHRITNEDRGAWSAFEAARAGALWIKDRTGFEMNEVTINWPSGTWPSSIGHGHRHPGRGRAYLGPGDDPPRVRSLHPLYRKGRELPLHRGTGPSLYR